MAISPETLPTHRHTKHVDRFRFMITQPNGSEKLSVYRRSSDGYFKCKICPHRGRNAKKMTVSARRLHPRPRSEPGTQGHVHNCILESQGSSDREGVAAIESVGVRYRTARGGPQKTITVERLPQGYFECLSCDFCETDAVDMAVSRQAVRWRLNCKHGPQEHLPECLSKEAGVGGAGRVGG